MNRTYKDSENTKKKKKEKECEIFDVMKTY
jgi:hypothetical protein